MALDKGEPSRPPPDLHERELKLFCSEDFEQAMWYRIAKTRRGPHHFSQDPGWRFSRGDMPGTLYIAESAATAFKEIFWDDLISRPLKERRLDREKVEIRSLYGCLMLMPFNVVDTTNADTLDAMSCHGGTFGGPYSVCQEWAFALRNHKSKPAGILYESVRNKGELCLALFEENIPEDSFGFTVDGEVLIDTPALLGKTPSANVIIRDVLSNGRWNSGGDGGSGMLPDLV